MRFRAILLTGLSSLLPLTVSAYQDPVPVKHAVEDYLRIQTKGLPGSVSYSVGSIDPGNQLPPCAGFLVKQEAGRLWGRVNLTVQCQAGATWSIYVPVQIKVFGNYLVARRNLARGQILTENDLETRQGDLTEQPGTMLESPSLALGKILDVSLAAGQPLRTDALRAPFVVQQGQRVTLISGGPGFSVSSEGVAINNATEGQVVRVRLANGQTISGLAKGNGVVEINP